MYSFSYLEPVCWSIQFLLLLPDLHTGSSRGRSGGQVFPCLSEFSTVYCDPQSKALAYKFPVVMYGCESWTIKKVKCRRIDAFELWCWRRLLRVPWTARRSNQSIVKEISPEYSLEGLRLKLNGHLKGRIDSLDKTLMVRKTEGGRRRDR